MRRLNGVGPGNAGVPRFAQLRAGIKGGLRGAAKVAEDPNLMGEPPDTQIKVGSMEINGWGEDLKGKNWMAPPPQAVARMAGP